MVTYQTAVDIVLHYQKYRSPHIKLIMMSPEQYRKMFLLFSQLERKLGVDYINSPDVLTEVKRFFNERS